MIYKRQLVLSFYSKKSEELLFSMLSLVHVGPKITDDRSVLGSRACVSFNTQKIRCTDQK